VTHNTQQICSFNNSGELKQVHAVLDESDSGSSHAKRICWSPTERTRFAVVGDSKFVEFWDVRSSQATSRILTTGSNINASWSPDGRFLSVSNYYDKIMILDPKNGAGQDFLGVMNMTSEVNAFSWSKNSDYMLVSGSNKEKGSVELLNFHDGKFHKVDSLPLAVSTCQLLIVDPTYKRMVVTSSDQILSFWNLNDLTCDKIYRNGFAIKCCSFSGDGKFCATASDEYIRIFDSTTAEMKTEVHAKCKVSQVAWNPREGSILALDTDPLYFKESSRNQRGLSAIRLLRL
jgi:THO complex subunit 3